MFETTNPFERVFDRTSVRTPAGFWPFSRNYSGPPKLRELSVSHVKIRLVWTGELSYAHSMNESTAQALIILGIGFWSTVAVLVVVWYFMLFGEYRMDKEIASYTYPELRHVSFREWLSLQEN